MRLYFLLRGRFIQFAIAAADFAVEHAHLKVDPEEAERGITIYSACVQFPWKVTQSDVAIKDVVINLIDTPGHVDFSYEVSRSLSACEGALLVVDASQGVEAQTVANCYTAIELGVEVVPVLNKIDLPQADPDRAKQEIEDVIGIDASEAVTCSASTGLTTMRSSSGLMFTDTFDLFLLKSFGKAPF